MQEPKAGRRIVSKSEYAKEQGTSGCFLVSGCGLLLIAIPCALATIYVVGMALIGLHTTIFDTAVRAYNGGWFGCVKIAAWSLLFILPCVGLTLALLGGAAACMTKAGESDVVPLTRANTADLPAPESLVRASAEPVQEQQTILLRAATETQETPPEQLVRASVGQE